MAQAATAEIPEVNCCMAQLFPLGQPTPQWFPEQIMAYVQVQYQAILDGEHALAVNYWRLGKALEALRKTFGHGHWEHFLKKAHLDKSKVSRARAIARTFGHEEELADLTIQQAYDRRPRRQKSPRPFTLVANQKGVHDFAQFLDRINRLSEPFIDVAGFSEEGDAAMLLSAVEKILAKFQMMRDLLQKQVSHHTARQDEVGPG